MAARSARNRSSGPRPAGAEAADASFEATGDLDGRAAEALRLELARLVRRYGVELTGFTVRPVRAARGSG